MEIRRATGADIDTIVAMRHTFLSGFRGIGAGAWAEVEENLRAYCAAQLGKDFTVLLGEEDGQTVCCAFLTMLWVAPGDEYPTGRYGFITNVYTLPACRGRGLITALLEELLAIGRAAGADYFTLRASDAGRPVYEKLGFTVEDETYMRLYARGPADG